MYGNLTCRMLLTVAVIGLYGSSARADFEAGRAAWNAGRPAEALAQWRAAAKTEDARAMLALGLAYVKGLGVPQDYVEAHKWLNLAAARGNAEAAAERGALAEKMTTDEQAVARRLARAWRSGGRVEPPKSAAVSSAAAPSAPAGPPPPRAIREAQGLLAALGYKPGPADGLWGGRTGRAYTAFLRDAGLPPAEMLTPDALRAMRAAAKGRNVAAATASPRQAPASQHQADPPPADLNRLVAAGDVDGLKATLEEGANVNVRDKNGWTPLMHAANQGYTSVIPHLLKAGADLDVQATDGATAIFIAALHGHSEIVEALVNAGADITVEGPKGKTALDVARAQGYSQILALPTVVALLEMQEREAKARKQREKALQRDKEGVEAFSLAKSSDTPGAYRNYLSKWCPGSPYCSEAGTRLDKSLENALVGKTFGGIHSEGDELEYTFLPSAELSAVSNPSSWMRGSASGTWKVEGGKVQTRLEWAGGRGWSTSEEEFDGDVLKGRARFTREGIGMLFGPRVHRYTYVLKEIPASKSDTERLDEPTHQATETDNTLKDDYSYQGGD